MRVALDLRCLETASGTRGIGRYARELARACLAQAPSGWSFLGLSWSGLATTLGLEDVRCPPPRRGIGWTDRWLLPPLFRKHEVDLYHSTAYALPRGRAAGVALVLTVHDLVADLHPRALSMRHRLALRRTFGSARAAHRVVAVSETTRRALIARYPVQEERVVTVPNGVAPAFGPAAQGSPGPSGFPRPFLLYVGGFDPLKNVPFLLRVLRRLQDAAPEMHLVVAGEEGPRRLEILRAASDLGLTSRIHAPGFVSDEHLASAYAEASAFVFPSLYEGFGLPPLEAMAAGCPVVSSPAGALAEVLGEGAILREPEDPEVWARELLALYRDLSLRAACVRAGASRAARFTWEATARSTLDVYRQAREEAGHP